MLLVSLFCYGIRACRQCHAKDTAHSCFATDTMGKDGALILCLRQHVGVLGSDTGVERCATILDL